MLTELIEYVKDECNIPYVEDNEAVLDGSFTVSPIMTDGLTGDGAVQCVVNHYAIDMFFISKLEAINSATAVWKLLNSKKQYCSGAPDYTFEVDAGFWHASILAQEVN